MHCAIESTITGILQEEDPFYDIVSLSDVDGFCEQDPLFTIDLLESSSEMMYGGLSTLDMISKDGVYREETYCLPSKRRKSERKEFEFIMDESLLSRATTNEKIHIASLFDVDGFCEQDPLLTTDLLESSDIKYGGLSTLDMISKNDVYREETHFFPSNKRRKSERKDFEFIMDESLLSRATTNKKILPTKPSREKKTAPSSTTTACSSTGSILALLTPKQLEQQLKHTNNRLTDSMERSTKSRKRLNEQDSCQEYCPSQGAFNNDSQFSDNLFVRSSSVLSSQSRANLILSQSRAQLASFKNTLSHTPLS
jgi:hypothetical protein